MMYMREFKHFLGDNEEPLSLKIIHWVFCVFILGTVVLGQILIFIAILFQ